MNTKFLFTLIAFIVINSCNPSSKEKNSENTSNEQEGILASYNEFPDRKSQNCLLVIAEDHSGSFLQRRLFSITDYRGIFEAFVKKYSGTIAIGLIGNPDDKKVEFFRTSFLESLKYTRPVSGMNIDEIAVIRRENLSIKVKNDFLLQKESPQKIDSFLRIVDENIIHYKPKDNRDATDVNLALKHVNDIVTEATFSDYDIIIVALLTDGIHEPGSGSMLDVNLLKANSKMSLITVGWENPKTFTHIPANQIKPFESKDGLFNYLTK